MDQYSHVKATECSDRSYPAANWISCSLNFPPPHPGLLFHSNLPPCINPNNISVSNSLEILTELLLIWKFNQYFEHFNQLSSANALKPKATSDKTVVECSWISYSLPQGESRGVSGQRVLDGAYYRIWTLAGWFGKESLCMLSGSRSSSTLEYCNESCLRVGVG